MINVPAWSNDAREIINELRKAPEVALFSHVSPDGDCIGSTLAVAQALKKMGRKVTVYNRDPIPHYLNFLPGVGLFSEEIVQDLPKLTLFIDCADFERAGYPREIFMGTKIINIDHHISNKSFGTLNWIQTDAAASGEIVYALIQELGVEIDVDIATNLYTAIATDTGLFQYSSTTPQTHRLAAELMEKGINLIELHHYLFNQKPLAQLKLLKHAIDKLELHFKGQLAVMTLSREDFRESGAIDSQSEGLINHARTIEGVEVAVILREIEPEGVRVGLRSNLWFDVNTVAAKFGGGGHYRAAGCTLTTSLNQAKEQIIHEIGEVIQGGWHNQPS